MNSSAPKIGFDRFIQLDWAAAALNVRAGVAGLNDLNALLDAAELGLEAKKKRTFDRAFSMKVEDAFYDELYAYIDHQQARKELL